MGFHPRSLDALLRFGLFPVELYGFLLEELLEVLRALLRGFGTSKPLSVLRFNIRLQA